MYEKKDRSFALVEGGNEKEKSERRKRACPGGIMLKLKAHFVQTIRRKMRNKQKP